MHQNNFHFLLLLSFLNHYLYIFIIPISFACEYKMKKFHFIKFKNNTFTCSLTSKKYIINKKRKSSNF